MTVGILETQLAHNLAVVFSSIPKVGETSGSINTADRNARLSSFVCTTLQVALGIEAGTSGPPARNSNP
jgi:hypothetical protein